MLAHHNIQDACKCGEGGSSRGDIALRYAVSTGCASDSPGDRGGGFIPLLREMLRNKFQYKILRMKMMFATDESIIKRLTKEFVVINVTNIKGEGSISVKSPTFPEIFIFRSESSSTSCETLE